MNAAVFSLLGGVGLFFYGLRELLRGFESFASSRIRPPLQKAFSGPFHAWLVGAGLTLISQSGNLSVIALMGLTEIGFIGIRSAYFAMLGATAGTTVWLWSLLAGWHLGALFLAVGSLGLFLVKSEHWEELMSVIVSIGLALLGVEMLYNGVQVLFADTITTKVALSTGSLALNEQLSFVLLGIGLGLFLQSASAPVVLLLSLIPQAELTLATGAALYLGATLGITLVALALSIKTRAVTKQLAWAHFSTKAVGVLTCLLVFPTFLTLVERIGALVSRDPSLLTLLVVTQFTFNLFNTLVFGLLGDPLVRTLANLIPEKSVRTLGLARQVRRMLYQDPILAQEEMKRQLRLLELDVKANYDQVMHRLTTTALKESFEDRALRERSFRALKFTIHDLLFSVDRHGNGSHAEGTVILSLLEYYGSLSRTLFHLEDHYEKGLSKKFEFPPEFEEGLAKYKMLLDDIWELTLLESKRDKKPETFFDESMTPLEELVLDVNKKLGVEYQGYSTWLMETAGYLRLISSDLGQLLQRQAQMRSLDEDSKSE